LSGSQQETDENQAETWEHTKYFAVFTTGQKAPAKTISEWYRELTFKRLKSLARLGHLPKYDDQSSRAWRSVESRSWSG
jgi:hypothetical protein